MLKFLNNAAAMAVLGSLAVMDAFLLVNSVVPNS